MDRATFCSALFCFNAFRFLWTIIGLLLSLSVSLSLSLSLSLYLSISLTLYISLKLPISPSLPPKMKDPSDVLHSFHLLCPCSSATNYQFIYTLHRPKKRKRCLPVFCSSWNETKSTHKHKSKLKRLSFFPVRRPPPSINPTTTTKTMTTTVYRTVHLLARRTLHYPTPYHTTTHHINHLNQSSP